MSEHKEQVKLIDWCDVNNIPIYSIPNAGKRGYKYAKYMRAEGLKKGMLDLCIPLPVDSYGAMYIEMKYGNNKLTEEQSIWVEMLRFYGNYVAVCYSCQDAIIEIDKYLNSKTEKYIIV